MPFKKGEPRPANAGRKKGILPTRQSVAQYLETVGFSPFETLKDIASGELECNVCRGKGRTKYQPKRAKEIFEGEVALRDRTCQSCYGSGKERISPSDRNKAASELAKYVAPQLKAIEVSGNADRPVVSEIQISFVEGINGKPA